MGKFSKDERDAAVDKYRQAAKDIREAETSEQAHEASDRLIDAQYEGLPRRFLAGWR